MLQSLKQLMELLALAITSIAILVGCIFWLASVDAQGNTATRDIVELNNEYKKIRDDLTLIKIALGIKQNGNKADDN